jgi:hypothetical protein
MVAAGEHRWTQSIFPAWVLMVSVVILVTPAPDRSTDSGTGSGTGAGTDTGRPEAQPDGVAAG